MLIGEDRKILMGKTGGCFAEFSPLQSGPRMAGVVCRRTKKIPPPLNPLLIEEGKPLNESSIYDSTNRRFVERLVEDQTIVRRPPSGKNDFSAVSYYSMRIICFSVVLCLRR